MRFSYFSLFILVLACQQESEFETYGASFDREGAFQLDQAISDFSANDTTEVKLIAKIDQVCQVKGCWMTLKAADGEPVRVTFKDYGFFVPKDAGGKKVIIKGAATVKELDEETARHYAEDAGQVYTGAEEPKEIAIVASGVLIEKGEDPG